MWSYPFSIGITFSDQILLRDKKEQLKRHRQSCDKARRARKLNKR